MTLKSIIFITFLAPVGSVSAQQSNLFELTGIISGLRDSTKLYLVRNNDLRNGVDTVNWTYSERQKFFFKGTLPFEGDHYFILIDTNKYRQRFREILIVLESKIAFLSANLQDLKVEKKQFEILQSIHVKGLDAHDEYLEFRSQQQVIIDSVNSRIRNIFEMYQNNKVKQSSDSVNQLMENARKPLRDFVNHWINAHPNSLVTPWLIYDKLDNKNDIKVAYQELEPRVKLSKWGHEINEMLLIADRVSLGAKATDFTFPTQDGEMVSLSEVVSKGKLTIVDFWASWCGPCIKEFPNYLMLYSKFHNRGLNIIFISLDKIEDEDKWKEAIRKYNLPWYNVRQTERGFSRKMFDAYRLPTTYLLDGDGRILGRDLEQNVLMERISKLLD